MAEQRHFWCIFYWLKMEEKISERLAVTESRLDQHEKRLNSHGERIDKLTEQNIMQDSTLAQMRDELKKNSETTRKNHEILNELLTEGKTTVKHVKLIRDFALYGIPALVALYFSLKQIGIF